MAHVNDVATYILERQGRMTTMKLHKLLYYSQAWHLVWDEEPLFEDRVEAWRDGPVIPRVYELHRGQFQISEPPGPGDPADLEKDEIETIDAVLAAYGDYSAYELSRLTHGEGPWLDARGDRRPDDRSHAEITPTAMYEYYSQWV